MALATIAIIAAVGGTVVNAQQQRAAAELQEEANKARARIGDIRAQRERSRAIQEQRVLSARTEASATASGGATSSTTAGAQASLQSQLASNLGFQQTQRAAQGTIFERQQAAQNALQRGAQAQALGQSIFQASGQQ